MHPDDRFSVTQSLAVFDRRLNAGDFRILAAISSHANAAGRCVPKQISIASMLGVTPQTVCLAIAKLSLCGYLQKTNLVESGRGKFGCEYLVRFDLTNQELADAQANSGSLKLRNFPNSEKAEFGLIRSPTSEKSEVHREDSQRKTPSTHMEKRARAKAAKSESATRIPEDFMPDDFWITQRRETSGMEEWELRTVVAECRDFWLGETGPRSRKTPRGWLRTIDNRIARIAASSRDRDALKFSSLSKQFLPEGYRHEFADARPENGGGQTRSTSRHRQSGGGEPGGIIGAAARFAAASR